MPSVPVAAEPCAPPPSMNGISVWCQPECTVKNLLWILKSLERVFIIDSKECLLLGDLWSFYMKGSTPGHLIVMCTLDCNWHVFSMQTLEAQKNWRIWFSPFLPFSWSFLEGVCCPFRVHSCECPPSGQAPFSGSSPSFLLSSMLASAAPHLLCSNPLKKLKTLLGFLDCTKHLISLSLQQRSTGLSSVASL